jgi:hypothetical protein
MMGRIIRDMSAAEYHAHPAISRSRLEVISRSPFHYFSQYLAPNPPTREETTALKMGTLGHCAILEPDELDHRYIVRPANLDMRTKAGKEWADSVPPGLIQISAEQRKAAESMRSSILTLPDVASALSRGYAEPSIFYPHPEFDFEVKIRPDWVHECGDGDVIIVDLKTTSDASPREFARSVANHGYHRQAAFYSDVFEKATGQHVLAFVFAVVESSYPFTPACYMLDDDAMRKGRSLYHADLQLLKHCMRENVWPAYGNEMQVLSLPSWALND